MRYNRGTYLFTDTPIMPRGRPVSNRLELTQEQFASLTQIANSRSEELRRV